MDPGLPKMLLVYLKFVVCLCVEIWFYLFICIFGEWGVGRGGEWSGGKGEGEGRGRGRWRRKKGQNILLYIQLHANIADACLLCVAPSLHKMYELIK